MPKILIIGRFVFLLFGADINEKRKHIHVEIKKGRKRFVAKFWLEPEIKVEEKGNLSPKEIKIAKKLILENYDLLLIQVNKFLKSERIKTIIKK